MATEIPEHTTVKLLHYGKCRNVYLSRDSQGNLYIIKRFYRKQMANRREYRNVNGFLAKKDWFSDFRRSVVIQLRVQHDRCVRCLRLDGFDPDNKDKEALSDEIDMVLEWCECGSLMQFDIFSPSVVPNMPVEVIKCIANDILQALEYLSKINVAHCDVKPDNVFMDRNGRCKLGDFSQSQFMDDKGLVKGAQGSLYFMAPEMISESPGYYNGSAIDMWAFGITLWILYFRSFPFQTLSAAVMNLMSEISNFDIDQKLSQHRRENLHTDDNFDDLIRWILCKDPQKRALASKALKHPWFSDLDYSKAKSHAAGILEDI